MHFIKKNIVTNLYEIFQFQNIFFHKNEEFRDIKIFFDSKLFI